MTHEINLFDREVETHYIQAPLPTLSTAPAITPSATIDPYVTIQIKRIIEALLFASSEPLSLQKIREVTDTVFQLKPREIRELILELQQEYLTQKRSFRLEEIAEGFLLRTCEEYSQYIELLTRHRRTEKLSQAAVEVLAIIAYRQPITRPQIEAIRGVDSSGTIHNLLERQLIEPVGKMEAPGRPTLYSTTKDFLKHFGLKNLHDLPPLKAALDPGCHS
jgi:segregation and condensation protein B